MNKTTVIICDSDRNESDRLQKGLASDAFDIETLADATTLEALAIKRQPSIVIANPQVLAFNEYDVCQKLMKDRGIPVMLMLEPASTHRVQIDTCRANDVVSRGATIDNLRNLIRKHMSVRQEH